MLVGLRFRRPIPTGPVDHLGQGVALEVFAHVVADLGPHGEENALSLVVTRPVLVRISEVTGLDGSVYGAHDV